MASKPGRAAAADQPAVPVQRFGYVTASLHLPPRTLDWFWPAACISVFLKLVNRRFNHSSRDVINFWRLKRVVFTCTMDACSQRDVAVSQLRIFSYLPNPRLWKATIAARLTGIQLDIRGAAPGELAGWLWDFDARPLSAHNPPATRASHL